MEKLSITFDKSAKEDVLELLGKSVNEEGYVVEKDDTDQKVITPEGEELMVDEFGGMRKGSQIFIKQDFFSILSLSKLV